MSQTATSVTGYVVGYDKKERGPLTWTVKVADPGNVHHGQKFVVYSAKGPLISEPGQKVSFKIIPILVGERLILKAVDVRLLKEGQTGQSIKSLQLPKDSETFNLLVIEDLGGARHVIVSPFNTRGEAEGFYRDELGSDERVVEFLCFSIAETLTKIDNVEAITGAFEVLKAMSYVDHSCDALEKLLTAIYRLSLKHQT